MADGIRPTGETRSIVADMSRTLRLAVIPGDGIGQEVVAEGLKVLSAALPADTKVETTEYDLGARRYHATGETLPDSVLEELKHNDAILLGAIGDPSVPSGLLERGLLLKLRFAFDHHVNLRPSQAVARRHRSAALAEAPIDFVVVREGTEGPYAGNGGTLRTGTPQEIATEVCAEHGVRHRARRPRRLRPRPGPSAQEADAGAQEQRAGPRRAPVDPHLQRGRDRVPRGHAPTTCTSTRRRSSCHPARALRRDRHRQPLRRHPDRPGRGRHRRHRPGRVAATSTPPAPSRPCSSRSTARPRTSPAPGKADPTATVLSAALLLQHLGLNDEAARVESAVAADLAARAGQAPRSTSQIGDALAARVAG